MNDVMEWLTLSFKLVAVSIMMDNFRPNFNTNITSLSKGLSNCNTDVHFSLDLTLGGVHFSVNTPQVRRPLLSIFNAS